MEHQLASEAVYEAQAAEQERCWELYSSGDALPGARDVRRLCRRGVPAGLRKHVWPHVLGVEGLRASAGPGYFAALLEEALRGRVQPLTRQIEMDLRRTFPGHATLSEPAGQEQLRQVLMAYAQRDPGVGYVQGMGLIAALMLIVVGDTELAFWCLAAVIEARLPARYFDAELCGARVEMAVFADLLEGLLPTVATTLHDSGASPELYATRWYVGLARCPRRRRCAVSAARPKPILGQWPY